jgi:glutamate synthase domain-containing protein 2
LAVGSARRARTADGGPDDEAWRAFREHGEGGFPVTLRDLLGVRTADPVPVQEVEPIESIVARFVSSAMSLGALSPEAHSASRSR